MTLTPDAPQPEDGDKFRKQDPASSADPTAPNGYGYDNVGNGAGSDTPPAPVNQPYSYNAPQEQYAGYVPPAAVPSQGGLYQNPSGQVPQNDMWSDAKKPENMSTILGAGSILALVFSFLIGPFALASPVMAIFGILQGNKATRFGVNATLGKTLSWIGLGLNIAGVLLIIMFFGLFLTMFAAAGATGA